MRYEKQKKKNQMGNEADKTNCIKYTSQWIIYYVEYIH